MRSRIACTRIHSLSSSLLFFLLFSLCTHTTRVIRDPQRQHTFSSSFPPFPPPPPSALHPLASHAQSFFFLPFAVLFTRSARLIWLASFALSVSPPPLFSLMNFDIHFFLKRINVNKRDVKNERDPRHVAGCALMSVRGLICGGGCGVGGGDASSSIPVRRG